MVKKKARRIRKPKAGSQFEKVVRDVLSAMDPNSVVKQGEWVDGPDGRRDLDVLVEGTVDGIPRRVLVECKDFNPNTTGPVGIGIVEELDSKRHDLDVDVSFICSNAGFTAGAISKAKRKGIGLIAVMREEDHRIRFRVQEEMYIRRVQVDPKFDINFRGDTPSSWEGVQFDDVKFRGAPLRNWIAKQAMMLISTNPVVKGVFEIKQDFRAPVEFESSSGSFKLTGIDFRFRISGGWFAQQIELDATAGIYDWLRRRVRLAPGFSKLSLRNVNFDGGVPIGIPPESELFALREVQPGEVSVTILVLEGLGAPEPVPEIGEFIVPECLDLAMPNLPIEAYTSEGA